MVISVLFVLKSMEREAVCARTEGLNLKLM